MNPAPQRALPSVEKLVMALGFTALPRPWLVQLARAQIAESRGTEPIPGFDQILESFRARATALALTRLQPVINGTGVLAHTNLGRAPLGSAAIAAVASVGRCYSNLELDLATGERGHRAAFLESGLALLCEAESATVVNNCAAALVLILRHFVRESRKEVIISRGELIQIGGGFRIPEILETSGATLREVGTTNRTTLDDYRRALSLDTALILRVHRSNFFMEGFVESPATTDLALLSHEHSLPVPFVEDLGSGALVEIDRLAPVAAEPRPQDELRAGADLVCFSGDKLLGGPQAGIIAGSRELVAGLKQDPFYRALRCDKLVFAALQATVENYLLAGARSSEQPPPDVPVLALMHLAPADLLVRARHIADSLHGLDLGLEIGQGESQIGGGVCPRSGIPSVTIRLMPRGLSVDDFAARLRQASPPVVAVVTEGRCQLDLRTVFPEQDEALIAVIRAVA